jgi:hypothetical protein
MADIGAEDLHQLRRAWELQHRLLAAESEKVPVYHIVD